MSTNQSLNKDIEDTQGPQKAKEFFQKVYSNVVTHVGNVCPQCGECNCRGEWFPSRVVRDTPNTWDETLHVDPHGYDWCEECEKQALEWNSKICDHCGLHQDNDRYQTPWGGEFCQECWQDECWYEDKRHKHEYERKEKAKKESLENGGEPIEVKGYSWNNRVERLSTYINGVIQKVQKYNQDGTLRMTDIFEDGKYVRTE